MVVYNQQVILVPDLGLEGTMMSGHHNKRYVCYVYYLEKQYQPYPLTFAPLFLKKKPQLLVQ